MTPLLTALALAGLFAAPAAGQISLRLVDPDGRPIPDVQVDLHGRAELIHSQSTSALGIADVNSDRWSDVRYIRLSHLAFQTRIVQADAIPASGVIRLEREVLALEGLDVTATEPCPIDDDPEARELWSKVASRYSRETGSRALSAYFSAYGEDGLDQDASTRSPRVTRRAASSRVAPACFT
jgi:hypothetical protein